MGVLRSLTQSCKLVSREANEQRAQDEISTQFTWRKENQCNGLHNNWWNSYEEWARTEQRVAQKKDNREVLRETWRHETTVRTPVQTTQQVNLHYFNPEV